MQLVVGETATVRVRAKWSGLVDYGGGIHWTFRSDRDHVARAFARIEDSREHDVEILAVGPGRAAIRQESNGRLESVAWVEINVVCGPEPPVIPAVAALRARIGESVVIAVASEIAGRTQFVWYLGRQGDHSHPLDAAGPEISFAPTAYGTHYIWVSAITPCSMSTAEFRIEVPRPRRRAALK